MRMRLKYVIGGALLSLATMAASGAANAVVLLTEPGPTVATAEGPIQFTVNALTPGVTAADLAALAAAAGAATVFTNEGGFAAGGDTVTVAAGPGLGNYTVTLRSAIDNDNMPEPLGELLDGTSLFMITSPFESCSPSGAGGAPTCIVQAPEPASLALLASGLIGLGVVMRRRRKAKA